MQADFLDAHQRHWDDAERLLQAQRWANADHLYGMAAECGLKRLMMAFGMPADSSGRPTDERDRKHANAIWKRFEAYRSGPVQGAGYVLPANNPFDNWKADDRYAHQSNFDQARAQAHRMGAQIVHDLITQAQRDGFLL